MMFTDFLLYKGAGDKTQQVPPPHKGIYNTEN